METLVGSHEVARRPNQFSNYLVSASALASASNTSIIPKTRRFVRTEILTMRPRGGKSHESHVCGTDVISATKVTGESLCASAEIMSGVPANGASSLSCRSCFEIVVVFRVNSV